MQIVSRRIQVRLGATIALLLSLPSFAQAQAPRGLSLTPCDSLALRRDTLDVNGQFAQLLAALSSIELHTRRLLGITGLRPAQLLFIDARNLMRGSAPRALEQAIGISERKITQMRSDLQNSMILRDALVERDVPMSKVIAVDVSPDATRATIYYRPQE